jgi:hypothetical protein
MPRSRRWKCVERKDTCRKQGSPRKDEREEGRRGGREKGREEGREGGRGVYPPSVSRSKTSMATSSKDCAIRCASSVCGGNRREGGREAGGRGREGGREGGGEKGRMIGKIDAFSPLPIITLLSSR